MAAVVEPVVYLAVRIIRGCYGILKVVGGTSGLFLFLKLPAGQSSPVGKSDVPKCYVRKKAVLHAWMCQISACHLTSSDLQAVNQDHSVLGEVLAGCKSSVLRGQPKHKGRPRECRRHIPHILST